MRYLTPTEAHVIHYTKKMFREHGLYDWSVTFDNARMRAGQCIHLTRLISLSLPLIRTRSWEETLMTVKHEVAHALVGHAAGHGPVWKAKFIALGGTGETRFHITSEQSEKLYKYRAVCPNGHQKFYARALTSARSCAECNPKRYDPSVMFTITEIATGKPMIYTKQRSW